VELEKRTLAIEAETPEQFVAQSQASAGSWEAARRTLSRERFDAVRRRGGDGPVRIDNEYVVIVARRRG
jgi:hypothetical protein